MVQSGLLSFSKLSNVDTAQPSSEEGDSISFHLILGHFCHLLSNHRTKFITAQGPSKEWITCEAQRKYLTPPCTQAQQSLEPQMNSTDGSPRGIHCWICPPSQNYLEILGFVCFFFTCGTAFILKSFFSHYTNVTVFSSFHFLWV